MELNIEPCGIPDKSIGKTLSVPFIFTPCSLCMNVQKFLHPLINHMHKVLQQVNQEEYSQQPWTDP